MAQSTPRLTIKSGSQSKFGVYIRLYPRAAGGAEFAVNPLESFWGRIAGQPLNPARVGAVVA